MYQLDSQGVGIDYALHMGAGIKFLILLGQPLQSGSGAWIAKLVSPTKDLRVMSSNPKMYML